MRAKNSGMKKGYKYSYKKIWITDGKIETQIKDNSEIPSGWQHGRLKLNTKSTTGYVWYNNGKVNKMFYAYERVPKDWNKGMLKKNIMAGKKWITNGSVNRYLDAHEDLPDGYFFGKSTNKTQNKAVWFTNGVENKKYNLGKDKIPDGWRRGKTTAKYAGLSEEERKIKIRNALSKALKGRPAPNKGKKASREARQHMSEAQSKITEEQRMMSKRKEYETRKANGSYLKHMTKAEKEALEILSKYFAEDDIEYQVFNQDRYPFNCDFYIKSLDLFIEINIYPSHGGKLFEGSDLDLEKLRLWKEKSKEGKTQYSNWIYTWTDLDTRKAACAVKNNLNYLSIYNMHDFEAVINDYLQSKIYKKN